LKRSEKLKVKEKYLAVLNYNANRQTIFAIDL